MTDSAPGVRGRRPWTWRWIVVLRDLPPMPPYSEIVTGRWRRRAAEHEAHMSRLAMGGSPVRIDVERTKGQVDGR